MDDDTSALTDPSTGREIGRLGHAKPARVARAVEAAAAALPGWQALGGTGRAAWLERLAAGLRQRQAALADLISLTNGKPLSEALADAADAAACLDYYAGQARNLDARQGTVAHDGPGGVSRTYLLPAGPVALILPWNFPLKICAWKLGPALAAGCTVVIKPSPQSPLAENAWGEIAAAIGLPAGVLNIVHGDGETGRTLAAAPAIAKVSFTGSTPVGQALMRMAADHVKRIGLELGGKSPIIVLDDADLDLAVRLVMEGVFYNCGQCCNATGRLLVARPLAGALTARLAVAVAGLRQGPPASGADLGPLISERQQARVRGFLETAAAEGLCVVAGGLDAMPPGRGFFVPPTVYADVPPTSRLWNEEIFGPVLTIASFDTDDEAIGRANDTEFGLAATVVGGNEARAARVAAALLAGHVYVNTPVSIPAATMWGGFKKSGLGRELGPWGLAGFLEPKTVTSARGGR